MKRKMKISEEALPSIPNHEPEPRESITSEKLEELIASIDRFVPGNGDSMIDGKPVYLFNNTPNKTIDDYQRAETQEPNINKAINS